MVAATTGDECCSTGVLLPVQRRGFTEAKRRLPIASPGVRLMASPGQSDQTQTFDYRGHAQALHFPGLPGSTPATTELKVLN